MNNLLRFGGRRIAIDYLCSQKPYVSTSHVLKDKAIFNHEFDGTTLTPVKEEFQLNLKYARFSEDVIVANIKDYLKPLGEIVVCKFGSSIKKHRLDEDETLNDVMELLQLLEKQKKHLMLTQADYVVVNLKVFHFIHIKNSMNPSTGTSYSVDLDELLDQLREHRKSVISFTGMITLSCFLTFISLSLILFFYN